MKIRLQKAGKAKSGINQARRIYMFAFTAAGKFSSRDI
jgi:hypothetical protein